MKEKIKKLIQTKYFHIVMLAIIILIILFIFAVLSIKYSVEGETNLPFNLSKIIAISTAQGIDNEDENNKWNIKVNQNNDIYLYITKNERYPETEVIKKITVDNFIINEKGNIGITKIYKPDSNIETTTFRDVEENATDKIEYIGDMSSDIKNMKISNQGGIIVFRFANTEVAQYISNDDEEINHSELLKKLNINISDLKINITFDITIELDSGKTYKSNIQLDLPIDNIVENGTQSMEINNTDRFIFKRVTL